MIELLVKELGEEVTSIQLLKWFRQKSHEVRCQVCGKQFNSVVWYMDTRPGNDIKLKEKGTVSVEIVCCNCGSRNPLSKLIEQLST